MKSIKTYNDINKMKQKNCLEVKTDDENVKCNELIITLNIGIF